MNMITSGQNVFGDDVSTWFLIMASDSRDRLTSILIYLNQAKTMFLRFEFGDQQR